MFTVLRLDIYLTPKGKLCLLLENVVRGEDILYYKQDRLSYREGSGGRYKGTAYRSAIQHSRDLTSLVIHLINTEDVYR